MNVEFLNKNLNLIYSKITNDSKRVFLQHNGGLT